MDTGLATKLRKRWDRKAEKNGKPALRPFSINRNPFSYEATDFSGNPVIGVWNGQISGTMQKPVADELRRFTQLSILFPTQKCGLLSLWQTK